MLSPFGNEYDVQKILNIALYIFKQLGVVYKLRNFIYDQALHKSSLLTLYFSLHL